MKKAMLMLALCLMLLTMAFSAMAEETIPEPAVPEFSGETAQWGELSDNQELEYDYIERLFQPNTPVPFGTTARDNLNELDGAYYDMLLQMIREVAAHGGSTVFTVELADLGITAIPFSGTAISNGQWTADATQAFWAALPSYNLVFSALYRDHPYELYWYDYTLGYSVQTAGTKYSAATKEITVGSLTLAVKVNGAYGSENTVTMNMDAAAAAAEHAREIVAAYADKSDYQKLLAYKEVICSLVTYDHDAVTGDSIQSFQADNNPWQLVNVFDEDPSTNVVCEGYTKAFQYLCDQSAFQDAGLYALDVSGLANGGSHAWNLVHMGGENYVVDVTWCDTDQIPGGTVEWFLASPVSGSVSEGYEFSNGGFRVYNDNTQKLYTVEQLTLSTSPYIPPEGSACGDQATWTLSDAGVLTISGTGAMWDYSREGAPWSNFRSDITQVLVESGITSLGAYAFYDCGNLTDVTVSGSVTGLGERCFRDCTALGSITFQGDAPVIGEGAFSAVTAAAYYPANNRTWTTEVLLNYGGILSWIAGSNEDTSGKCGENAFWTLADGVLTVSGTGPMWDYSTYIPAPWDRESVRQVVVNAGITRLGTRAFSSCRNLTSISIPDSVTQIGGQCFSGCYSLGQIAIPDAVTVLDYACFYNCTALTEIALPGGITSLSTQCFKGCTALGRISIPAGVTQLESWCFGDCTALTEVILPANLETLGYACFYSCSSLWEIAIPASVAAIDDWCFSKCEGLESVILPGSVTALGEYAFGYCTALQEITFQGDCPTLGGSAFSGVTATAYYPGGNTTWTEAAMDNYGGNIIWSALGTTPMYRLYNRYTNEHLFLTSSRERTGLIGAGWTDEGIGWTAATTGDPVYRLYNPNGDFHFYSKTWSEVEYLLTLGWMLDGPVSCDAGEGGAPIYRLFNPYEMTNYHHYTADAQEAAFLADLGWVLEGIAWYAAD